MIEDPSVGVILRQFLLAVAESEGTLEGLRQQLYRLEGFDADALYSRLDRDDDGDLAPAELVAFLEINGITDIREAELQEVMKFYDEDGDGRLGIDEFCRIVKPCEDNKLGHRGLRNALVDYEESGVKVGRTELLSKRIEKCFTKIIVEEIRLQRKLEQLKITMSSFEDYSSLSALMMFDLQDGHIHTGNLDAFFRNLGHDQATPVELIRIIRRIDNDGDAFVSYQEFDDYISLLPAIAEFY